MIRIEYDMKTNAYRREYDSDDLAVLLTEMASASIGMYAEVRNEFGQNAAEVLLNAILSGIEENDRQHRRHRLEVIH